MRRNSTQKAQMKVGARLLMFAALMCALVSMPSLSGYAISAGSSTQPVMTVAVTNNSARDITHLYLSPVDRSEWGPDQMDGSALKTGQTFTITDVSCSGNEIKVIAEDKDGCFLYGVVSCAQASTGWTITPETPVDCGS
jgi:hypothetical protein